MPSRRMEERLQERVRQQQQPPGQKPGAMALIVAIPLLFACLFAALLVLRAPTVRVGGEVSRHRHDVTRVRTGMSYKEVIREAGPPVRSDPPNALEGAPPVAAVLFYKTHDGGDVRVIMTGPSVSMVETDAPPFGDDKPRP